jgi:hypothetical protein
MLSQSAKSISWRTQRLEFLPFFRLKVGLFTVTLSLYCTCILGLHGFTDNGTIWPSPIGLAASFNTDLLQKAAATIATEAEGLGYSQAFAPVLDLSRELRWGRVEENFGEDPFL